MLTVQWNWGVLHTERGSAIPSRCQGSFHQIIHGISDYIFPLQTHAQLRTQINNHALPNCSGLSRIEKEKRAESNAALNGRNPGERRIKYVQPSALQAPHCSSDAKITAVDNVKLQTVYKELELEITALLKTYHLFKKKPQVFQLSWAEELVCLFCKG